MQLMSTICDSIIGPLAVDSGVVHVVDALHGIGQQPCLGPIICCTGIKFGLRFVFGPHNWDEEDCNQ